VGGFDATVQAYTETSGNLKGLPQGIIQATSDLELRHLWSPSNLRSKVSIFAILFILHYIVLFKSIDDDRICKLQAARHQLSKLLHLS